MPWDETFDEPVKLPNGRAARTLRQAARFITKLPQDMQDNPQWKIATRALIDAAEGRAAVSTARFGVLRAIQGAGSGIKPGGRSVPTAKSNRTTISGDR